MIYIGIDPGKNGGIAVINDSDNSVDTYTFSEERIVAELLIRYILKQDCKCVLEKVNAMPGQGVVSMFNFG